MRRFIQYSLISFLAIALTACEKKFIPKPKAYPKIDLPEQKYIKLTDEHPYRFEYPASALVFDDTFNLFEPHWVHVYYPEFKANVQLTYKSVKQDKKRFEELIDESFKLAGKHNFKAYSIEDNVIKTPLGLTATVIELSGEVPSQFQFFCTDTTENFLRGALYFGVADRNDSLAPVIEFIKKDMIHLLNTLEWRKFDFKKDKALD